MLVSKTTTTKWNANNKSDLLSHGYNFTKMGDDIEINVEHLSKGSHIKVNVKCDYCGDIKPKMYKTYLLQHDENYGDCCTKCKKVKTINTNIEKYGVEWANLSDDVQNKRKATCLDKYGFEHHMYNNEIKNKVINTCVEKHGGMGNASDEIRSKVMHTQTENGNVRISKQEIEVYNILKEIYGEDCCTHGYALNNSDIVMDILLNINGSNIDIEYDGLYWHKDRKQKDYARDVVLKSLGYKVFRIKGNKRDDIPTREELIDAINRLVKDDYSYTQIDMNLR